MGAKNSREMPEDRALWSEGMVATEARLLDDNKTNPQGLGLRDWMLGQFAEGKNQDEVATILGVSRPTISSWLPRLRITSRLVYEPV